MVSKCTIIIRNGIHDKVKYIDYWCESTNGSLIDVNGVPSNFHWTKGKS